MGNKAVTCSQKCGLAYMHPDVGKMDEISVTKCLQECYQKHETSGVAAGDVNVSNHIRSGGTTDRHPTLGTWVPHTDRLGNYSGGHWSSEERIDRRKVR